MNPGSIHAAIAWAASEARGHGNLALADDLEKAGTDISGLISRAHICLELAAPNPDGSKTHCIPSDALNEFSASLARVGGAS